MVVIGAAVVVAAAAAAAVFVYLPFFRHMAQNNLIDHHVLQANIHVSKYY